MTRARFASPRAHRGKAGAAVEADTMVRLAEAEDTLRAIGAGEVDAFVISDAGAGQRIFTLATADRPYRRFVEQMRDGAATVSSAGLILYANHRLAELLSCPREVIVGTPLQRFLARGERAPLAEQQDAVDGGATLELTLRDVNGEAVPVLVGSALLDLDGDRLTCLTFTDLRSRKAQEREIARLLRDHSERLVDLQGAQAALTEQATHDSLTGLPNRAVLVDRIDQALAQADRKHRCTAVLFIDLDAFKHVNDTRGHASGDLLLQTVGRRLTAALRPMDTVARLGGDEFVVLAPDLESDLQVVAMSRRLLATLASPRGGPDDGERIAASVGISVSVGGRGPAETLLHEADTAMYKAKLLGGGRTEIFDAALALQIEERADARLTLQTALNGRRVVLRYQPIVDLPSGLTAGYEALARIVRDDGSIMGPAAFIPAAEANGLVVPLGTRVLGIACREGRSWRPAEPGRTAPTVAVNVSARQLESGDLAAIVRRTLSRTGLAPDHLHLELTETAIMDLDPLVLRQLGRMRDLGVQIGLDDFGTGYASLRHLRHLPLTFVKIDQSFVAGLAAGREDQRIVAAVVDLAANLGLRSIAEGVETAEQLALLRELGCDQAQGYLFARPMTAAALPESPTTSAR